MGLFDDLNRLVNKGKNIANQVNKAKSFIGGDFKYTPIQIDRVPQSTDEFIQMRNELSTHPYGGAALFLLALKVYKENPELGNQLLVLAVDKKRLAEGDVYKGYDLVRYQKQMIDEQLEKYPFLPNSYIKGAKPENNYNVQLPYIYEFTVDSMSGDPKHDEIVKVYVKCYGADRHRPIQMHVNDKGIWKAMEWSSILTGVRPPANADTDEL